MTSAEFNLAMIPMKKRWPNSFPEELTTRIFDRIKFVTADELKAAIDNMIACERYAPLLPKFEESLGDALRNARERFKSGLAKNITCDICKGLGRISVDVEGSAPYSFRCDCKIGQLFYPNHPQFRGQVKQKIKNQEHESKSPTPPSNSNFKTGNYRDNFVDF